MTTISPNFICLICFNVAKGPVLCPRNQHCFCRGCITKHLENSRRCPTCADELTEETLTEPNRIVKDYLNELNIRCIYHDRGCEEIVQLHLDQHEDSCEFTPVVCGNQDCGAISSKRDLRNLNISQQLRPIVPLPGDLWGNISIPNLFLFTCVPIDSFAFYCSR